MEGLSLQPVGAEKEERPGNQCQGLLAGSARSVGCGCWWGWKGSTTAGSGPAVEDALGCPLGLSVSLQSLQWRGWMSCWCLQNMGGWRVECPLAFLVSNAASGAERLLGVCWGWGCQEKVLVGQEGVGR